MSVLGGVFDSLKAMSQLQLLLAFVACTGYALAQGRLLGRRGRRYAASAAGASALGFVAESREWMQASMLLAFAVAGLGLFVAMVWLTSRTLGLARARREAMAGGEAVAEAAIQPGTARSRTALSGEHAHSTF